MLHNDAVRLIKNTFESAYDEEKFVRLINELFSNTEHRGNVYSGSLIPNAYKDFIKSYKYICKYVTPSGEELSVLSVNLSKNTTLERARTAQRNFIANYMKERGKNACLVAFYTDEDNKQHWRFSFVRTDTSFDLETFKLQSTITPAKRYSYMVGDRESSHTAQQQLCQLLETPVKTPELDDLENAFAVERVSDDFFYHYKELFLQLVENIQEIIDKDSRIKFEFVNKNISAELFCKKLMGQIVFLYFIQKKGWLGVAKDAYWGTGDKHFMRTLFETAKSQGKNYFNDFLEPLFYEALASERKSDGYFDKLGCRIPFLNGGLFEPISGYNWQETDIVLDNDIFSNKDEDGILDVFDRYNFTVREDEPLEKEIAVDPEMLGKVFENLLEIKDRKSKGTFYTPREIVHYMCQQSLIQYLNTKMDGKVDISDIEFLVRYGDVYSELQDKVVDIKSYESRVPEQLAHIKPYAEQIDNALANIKICDPAVGSGAFPVGMMHEIIRTRQTLLDSGFIKADRKHTIYEYKRQIIQNSIYGVDIESGAVEIAKLRLWLSLVVEEDDITNIKSLPNLDYKIVCGNSLLDVSRNLLNDMLYKKLEELKTQYFDESRKVEKRRLKKEIDTIIKELIKDGTFDFEIYFSEVFHEKGGFDVIIGNPPYVSAVEHSKNNETERKIYRKLYPILTGAFDLYTVFLLKGIKISNKKGIYSWIIPNKFLVSNYSEQTLAYLKSNGLYKVIDVSIFNVFKTAAVYPIILIGNKVSAGYTEYKIKNVSDLETNRLISIDQTKNYKTFSDFGIKIGSGTTGFQAKLIVEDISTESNNHNIPFIVSGSIDRYFINYKNVRYMGNTYPQAYIKQGKAIADSKWAFWCNEKIVIAGMTKVIEATFCDKPLAIGVGAYAIYDYNGFDKYFLLGILNSKFVTWYLNTKFKDKHLSGGYLAINKSTIEKLPLQKPSKNIEEFVRNNVLSILNITQSDDYLENQEKQSVVKEYEKQIDLMVYKLYDLTPEEIAEVEKLYPSTKGSKDE